MSKFVKQHWYAKRYLKEFSSDGINIYICVFNGSKQIFAPYNNQCQADNFYSKNNKDLSEKVLCYFDNLLINFTKTNIPEDIQKDEVKQSMCLYVLINLHFGSIKYINQTNVERWDVISRIPSDWIWKVLLKRNDKNSDIKEIFYYLSLNYNLTFLEIDNSHYEFVTCDSPVCITKFQDEEEYIISFPISPKKILFCFNKYRFKLIRHKITNTEVLILNILTAKNATDRIYSRLPLRRNSFSIFKDCLSENKIQKRGKISGKEYLPSIFNIDKSTLNQLSFISKRTDKIDEGNKIIDYQKSLEILKRGEVEIFKNPKQIKVNKSMGIGAVYSATRAFELNDKDSQI